MAVLLVTLLATVMMIGVHAQPPSNQQPQNCMPGRATPLSYTHSYSYSFPFQSKALLSTIMASHPTLPCRRVDVSLEPLETRPTTQLYSLAECSQINQQDPACTDPSKNTCLGQGPGMQQSPPKGMCCE